MYKNIQSIYFQHQILIPKKIKNCKKKEIEEKKDGFNFGNLLAQHRIFSRFEWSNDSWPFIGFHYFRINQKRKIYWIYCNFKEKEKNFIKKKKKKKDTIKHLILGAQYFLFSIQVFLCGGLLLV